MRQLLIGLVMGFLFASLLESGMAKAEEITPPTGKSSLVEKIGCALAAGLVPGTDEFFQAIGLSASQNNITPTAHLGLFGPIRDRFSPDAQALIRQQRNAVEIARAIQAEQIKHLNDPKARNNGGC
jgi:hypothetical protein